MQITHLAETCGKQSKERKSFFNDIDNTNSTSVYNSHI